ncbi:histone-lysine N-methyltransferase ASHH3-like isoform X2 [Solanum pennellii]|uniref:Histone-lysine N-methyltransferase ASHH3-like isoform X2 n=1 Tax=Solanum pennellii TaxID=28526 RepID=A0ABM1G6Y8_SOLPN|nr:histone-lysine N-methyltransferase ASHH3-like isoform X2 [Solanum pennellii]
MPATPMKKSATRGGIGNVFNKLTSKIGDPVDFELPDWLSKWQPTPYPYTSIRRNIYLTNKGKRRLEDDGISCTCSSTAESSDVCGMDCLCSMLWSSCTSGCKCGSSCLNKPFHQRPVKKMKIVKTEKCGTGIVADEDIKTKEFVVEYVGEVIDDKTCEERLWKLKHSGETNFYLCEINRDMVIDATYKGNKSRYINHSCCPNTEMQRWMIDGENRIGIFATRDIKRGEHLTYDYQFVQFGADQDCHCGAINCKRKLGIRPNKLKLPSSDAAALKLVACQDSQTEVPPKGNWSIDSARKIQHPRNCTGQIIRIIRSFDQSPVDSLESRIPDVSSSFGIIKQFDRITKKHLIMFEDGSAEHLDLSKEDWRFCNFA